MSSDTNKSFDDLPEITSEVYGNATCTPWVSFHYTSLSPPSPKLVYTIPNSEEEANRYLSQLQGDVLGFDVEYIKLAEENIPVLLQFCDRRLIVLVQLSWTEASPIPSRAVEILCDPAIYKVGVELQNDCTRLVAIYPRQFDTSIKSMLNCELGRLSTDDDHDHGHKSSLPTSLLELSHLAWKVDPLTWPSGYYAFIELKRLCGYYLGYKLNKKAKSHKGSWTDYLTDKQRDYAANDVCASLHIYLKLQAIAADNHIQIDRASLCTPLKARSLNRALTSSFSVHC